MSFVELLLSKLVTIPALIVVVYRLVAYSTRTAKAAVTKEDGEHEITNPFAGVSSVSKEFNWSTAEPIRHRPFKDLEYQVKMGLTNVHRDEWLYVESTYKGRTDIKKGYLEDPIREDEMVYCSPRGEDAVQELYETVTQFMLEKYPMCFEVRDNGIYNKIRDETIPRYPSQVETSRELIHILARFVEEDLILLLPNADGEYTVQAGIFAFAAGFNPKGLAGATLDQIHHPVPRYRTGMQKGMKRFFERVKPGMLVQRQNWNLQPHNKLAYYGSGKNEENDGRGSVLTADELDFSREVFLRSERQTVTRLPKTGAAVFAVRTYTFPLSEIKEDGPEVAERLVRAMDRVPPDVAEYKGHARVKQAAEDYMLGRSEGCMKAWIVGMA